jgi:hypothetical protein
MNPQYERQHSQNSYHMIPKVTSAAKPFEKMIAPSSYLYDELLRDQGYRHALSAGVLWQSLCSQHVHFPSLWYDGEEPARPPLGCVNRTNKWKYLGRHRVAGDPKLNSIVGNRGSSGKLMLHLIVTRSYVPIADLTVGCFHPNARGIRVNPNRHDPTIEECRDVWIGYRARGPSLRSPLEDLLIHINKGYVDPSPLGGKHHSSSSAPVAVTNDNLRAVFGDRPPLFTLFVSEQRLYNLLQSQTHTKCPASITLMREFLLEQPF